LSGEGIVYGMEAAYQLVTRLPADLDAGGQAKALSEFETWFRRAYRAHLISSQIAHRLMSIPWWAKHMIRAANNDPVVFRDAVDLLFGLGHIRAETTWRILLHGW
jgi:hypothetical protein